MNTLTLRATDLAGNTSTTSLSLLHEEAQAGPSLALFWPPEGARLAGDLFTCFGQVSDPAVAITATISPATGTPLTQNGVVELDGTFWIHDLPLATGASRLTLVATDASGRSTTVDISIQRNPLTFTVFPVPEAQAHCLVATVSATMDSSTHAVWLNGVRASLDASGVWTATVPMNQGSTALVQARAIPLDDNGGNGSGGGGPVTYNNSANPQSPGAVDAKALTKRPFRLYVQRDFQQLHFVEHAHWSGPSGDWTDWDTLHDYYHDWEDGAGGTGEDHFWDRVQDSRYGSSTMDCKNAIDWDPSYWPDVSWWGNGQATGDQACPALGPNSIRFIIGQEDCRVSDARHFEAGYEGGLKTFDHSWTRKAKTTMHLFTGVTQRPRKRLVVIDAAAGEILNKWAVPSWGNFPQPWGEIPMSPIDPKEVFINGKPLNEDGRLFLALEENIDLDVTPRVDGVDFFTFSEAATWLTDLDLDVDSDNENGLERSDHEDEIEQQTPGKFVTKNNGDVDSDGIPDFADGYDLFGEPGVAGQSASFTPLALELPQGIDVNKAKLKFDYSASDPAAVQLVNGVYIPAPGGLRIWAMDGGSYRKKALISHYRTDESGNRLHDGDYLAPGEYWATNVTLLYIEGIRNGNYSIKVALDPDGQSGFLVSDEVVVTVAGLDVDIDSDNNNGFNLPERSAAEDQIEDDQSKPGKILPVNDEDSDSDGIPDFADGFDWGPDPADNQSPGDRFTPLVLELPAGVDPAVASILVTYIPSDPATVTHQGDPLTWLPGSGNLRIWKKDAGQARIQNSAKATTNPGDYVEPGEYDDLSRLGFSESVRVVTLYVEGVRPSSSPGDQRIAIDLDPDGDGPLGWSQTDAVRVMAGRLKIVSRDKFLAGTVEVPPGMDSLELEFANTTSGENLGRYGNLLGNSTTRIYNSVEEILSDSDVASGGQPPTQKVWFVRNPSNSRTIDFYTCFDFVGHVEVRFWANGTRCGAFEHTLSAASDFADWISYVDGWVKGVGFQFVDISIPPVEAAPAAAPPVLVLGPIHNYTRACLIQLFNVVCQVEGLEAVALGFFDGVKTGLRDDWDCAMAVKHGVVFAGNWGWTQAQSKLIAWRDNPVERALQLKQGLDRFVAEAVFRPLQSLGSDFSTSEGFKNRAWATWDRIKGGAARLWTINSSLSVQIAEGLMSWLDDFHARMLQGGERVAFQNTPWNQNALVNDLTGYGRECAYTFGYVYGYLIEQVTVGVATGFTLKVGQVMVKGGVVLAGALATKTVAAVAARSHLLKKTLIDTVLAGELRLAVERGLVKASKAPVSTEIRETVSDFVERGFAGFGADRATTGWKEMVGTPFDRARLKKLFLEAAEEEMHFYRRAADVFRQLGIAASPRAMTGWLKIYENLLPLANLDLDRWDDFVRAFKATTPEEKAFLKETLEAAADETPENILAQGLKMPERIKNVYPTMRSYVDKQTLLDHATDKVGGVEGLWQLHVKSSGRYISPDDVIDQSSAKSLFQLPLKESPPGVFWEEPTTGRFKCIIRTEDIADDCYMPGAYVHSGAPNSGAKDWLEPVVADNRLRGGGGGIQFTQKKAVIVEVYDLKVIDAATGNPTKVLNRAHLDQLLRDHP